MMSSIPGEELPGGQRLIGRWATEGSHPLLPGDAIRGQATFEWLPGRRFVVQRSHYDHPDIPDATAIIGVTGEHLRMHYFDNRGVYRVYEVSLEPGQWRFWRDDPGFGQRFTGVFSADGGTITGQGEMCRDGSTWEPDLALTYRRTSPGHTPTAGTHDDLNELARRVIGTNHYLTLGTTDPDGRPRLSPVYYTPARYTDLYWVSSPDAQHSRNLAARPEAEIVIFDSTAPVGQGEAVYLSTIATEVPGHELEAVCPEAFRTTPGAHRFTPADLRDGDIRLYVARVRSCEVHVPGRHPIHGRGLDSRQPASP
ncbi:MAG TPA: pyridoxamine 5'-phosphate oxidase family protein [Streptosporangiaceae bacterium]